MFSTFISLLQLEGHNRHKKLHAPKLIVGPKPFQISFKASENFEMFGLNKNNSKILLNLVEFTLNIILRLDLSTWCQEI